MSVAPSPTAREILENLDRETRHDLLRIVLQGFALYISNHFELEGDWGYDSERFLRVLARSRFEDRVREMSRQELRELGRPALLYLLVEATALGFAAAVETLSELEEQDEDVDVEGPA
jgi:hypothetical protein